VSSGNRTTAFFTALSGAAARVLDTDAIDAVLASIR